MTHSHSKLLLISHSGNNPHQTNHSNYYLSLLCAMRPWLRSCPAPRPPA